MLTLDNFDSSMLFDNNFNIHKLWCVINDYNLLSLCNLHKLLKNIFNINIDKHLLNNIENIYQLSKIITPLNHKINNADKIKNIKKINIDSAFYSVIMDFKINVNNNITLKDTDICHICTKNNLNNTFVKTSCNHITCLSCFKLLHNYSLKENIETKCGYCRNTLNNKTINLVNFKSISLKITPY